MRWNSGALRQRSLRRSEYKGDKMYRTTTPTHTIVLPIQTSTCDEILLTYKQNDIELDKHYENGVLPDGMTLNGNKVYQVLTQEETNMFNGGWVNIQIRVLTNEGKSYASQIFRERMDKVLDDVILS